MSWKHPILALCVLVLLAGCTQSNVSGGGQTGGQGLPSIPGLSYGIKSIQELSSIGVAISGQNGPISVRAIYPEAEVGGKKCRLALSYLSSSCNDAVKVSGNAATWCDGKFAYRLEGNCGVAERAEELKTQLGGGQISPSVFLPWKDEASDVEVKMEVQRPNAKVTYMEVTGDYAKGLLDQPFKIFTFSNRRAFCTGDCKKVYFFLDDPSKIIMVEALDSEVSKAVAGELIGQNLRRVSEQKPTDLLEYIPVDSYSATNAPILCYNPYGVVKVEPGLFTFKEGRITAKTDISLRLMSPASFVINPLGVKIGGKQMASVGLPFNKLEVYQNRYRACQLGCSETCKFDDVLVMRTPDCNSFQKSVRNTIVSKVPDIYDILVKLRPFQGINDFICVGLIGSTDGERFFFGDYTKGLGLGYGRVTHEDKTLDFIITGSNEVQTTLLSTLIEKKVNKKFDLKLESESGNCKLYSWGKENDWRGYAGYCSESNGLQLLFMNHCTQQENCQASASAFFNYLTK